MSPRSVGEAWHEKRLSDRREFDRTATDFWKAVYSGGRRASDSPKLKGWRRWLVAILKWGGIGK